jgi:predicted metal-dependent peptidase
MGPDLLCKSLSETVGILKIVGYPCPAFAVDTIVHEVRDVCDAAAIKKMLRGGGGTDMGTAIKFAAEKKFNMVIIMTDCLTPWPRKEDMPRDLVVIVCNVSGQKQSVPAHVGRVVEVK